MFTEPGERKAALDDALQRQLRPTPIISAMIGAAGLGEFHMSRVRIALLVLAGLSVAFWSATPRVAWAQVAFQAPSNVMAYWRGHGPGSTMGTDPSETAPGLYPDAPALFVHSTYGDKATPAQAELMRRRLDIAFKALMGQPSLANIHGSSLSVAINVARAPTEFDGVLPLSASLTFNAKKVLKDDPKTIQKNGRYVTPWLEGAVLEVVLNPYDFIAGRDLVAGRVSGRSQALNAGTTVALMVTDTPPSAVFDRAQTAAALARDASWTGGAGSHPVLVQLSGSRHDNLQLASGRTPPTDALARLAAAAAMVDWEDVQRQMAEVR